MHTFGHSYLSLFSAPSCMFASSTRMSSDDCEMISMQILLINTSLNKTPIKAELHICVTVVECHTV